VNTNWIECDPKEATRCVCNGVELGFDSFSGTWWSRGHAVFTSFMLEQLNAKFYKEGPKVYQVYNSGCGPVVQLGSDDGLVSGDRVHVTKVDA
jgi:hypothetical protein